MPKTFNWFGDMTGLVMNFKNQHDCLEFIKWLERVENEQTAVPPVCQACKRSLAVASVMGTAGLCVECAPGGFALKGD